MLRIREAFAATAFILVLAAVPGYAQTIDPDLWITNGDVYAVASHGGTVYIGGTFSEVGRATGTAVPIDTASGALPAAFPKVNGQVFAVIADGAGGWYLGGEFTSVGGQSHNYIAHVAANLSVSSWNPQANSTVRALALRGSTVYAGGYFTNIGGQPRNYLAALDATTGAASSWNPNPNNVVYALAVNTHSFSCPEGTCFVTNVYVGGDFGTIGGQSRAYLSAIDATTGAASSWNPNPNDRVITVQATGNSSTSLRVYAGGFFGSIGGQPRNYIAALNAAGNATTWNPNANNLVQALAISGGTVYAGGSFTSIGGQARNYIAALNNTGAATSWNPDANLSIQTLAVSGSTVYAGGDFTSIGGQSRNYIAALDATTAAATSWNPNANSLIRSLAVSGSTVYAGGLFTSVGGVARNNIAALDAETGAVTAWNPDANGAVYALALEVSGEWVYTVYAGGDFNTVGGQFTGTLAALDAVTGVNTGWSVWVLGNPIRCLALAGSTLCAGGEYGVHGFDTTTGVRTWYKFANGYVYSLAVRGLLYAGGNFTEIDSNARNNIAAMYVGDGTITSWNPNANNTVRCLAVAGSTVYAGGDFTSIGGQSRNRVAAIDVTTGGATLWHPNANDAVHSLTLSGSTVFTGGLFTNIGGQTRNRIAALDFVTAAATAWNPNADGLVRALAVNVTAVYAGGSFSTIGGQIQGRIAAIESPTSVTCAGSGPSSPAGDAPRAIVGADLDNDGIRDLVACSAAVPAATVLRGGGTGGVGDGTFSVAQSLSLGSKPMQAVAADFDSDGFQDIAISQATQAVSTGSVEVFLNNGGTLQPSSTISLVGRADGLASADMDLDGILDLVVCLSDSASNPNRAGVQVFRGGGQGGVWDGTFVVGPKFPTSSTTASGRVLVQDFNQDGVPDISFTTNTGSLRTLRFGSPLVPVCVEGVSFLGAANLTTGDFNEDGRQDIAWASSQTIGIVSKNAVTIPQCSGGAWFSYPDPDSLTYLPSPARDVAALDFDQDSILDLAVTLEGSVQLFPGRGTGGVGDGTFGPPITLASIDAWRIAVGDFVTNGSPDLVVSQQLCGSVSVIPQTSAPTLPIDLTLQSPNGGEVWPQGIAAPTTWSTGGDVMSCGVAVTSDGRASLQPMLAKSVNKRRPSENLPQITSSQLITWTKGAGVQGVDVEVSRDDGIGWQLLATNAPGTSLTWIVTSPGTPRARVRVSDAAVAQRSDASDGAFLIPGGPTGVAPDEQVPRVAAFSLRDRNPVRGIVRFKMSVPAATEVEVQVFDVSGRLVRSLADGRVAAGSHDVIWDTRDARGSVASRGVYFVRARFDSFTAQRKVVVLR